MTTPKRIQRRRTAGWTAPLDDQGRPPVYVGRGSCWGNPFRPLENRGTWDGHGRWLVVDNNGVDYPIAGETREHAVAEAVRLFEQDIVWESAAFTVDQIRSELAGRDLMCWCPLPDPGEPDNCHARVLMDLAAGGEGRG